jgi:hypothetical protein
MDEPINSPVVKGDKTPEFGNSLLDAFKRLEAKESPAPAPDPQAAQKQQEQQKPPAKADPAPPTPPDTKKPLDIPKREQQPAQDPEVPKTIKSTKAADDFKAIKAERDALAKQIEDLKKSPAANDYEAKLKALQEERDQFSEKLKLLDIERHPEFVKKYETKLGQINESIRSVVGTDATKLDSLLKQPDSDYRNQQIDEIVESLTPAKRAKLGALLVQQEQLQQERGAEIESAKKDYDRTVARYREDATRKDQEAVRRAEATWQSVAKLAPELEVFQPVEGDPKSTEDINQSLQLAKDIFAGNNSEEDLAKAALWAVAAPRYRQALYAQIEVNKRLQAELSKFKGAQPGIESKATSQKSPAQEPNAKSDDFIKSVMSKIR